MLIKVFPRAGFVPQIGNIPFRSVRIPGGIEEVLD